MRKRRDTLFDRGSSQVFFVPARRTLVALVPLYYVAPITGVVAECSPQGFNANPKVDATPWNRAPGRMRHGTCRQHIVAPAPGGSPPIAATVSAPLACRGWSESTHVLVDREGMQVSAEMRRYGCLARSWGLRAL